MSRQTPRPSPRLIARPATSGERMRSRLDFRLLLAGVVALGAGNFFWQLGSGSYFVDEVLSIEHALHSVGTIPSVVTKSETTPWTFFWGLHGWLYGTGSQSEWITRLPSALAGVALVGAVFWMARALLDRRGSLLAAALTALSPLVLTYAQQVRVYVFVMLTLTITVGLTVRAVRRTDGRRRLLIAGAVAAILSLWLHYTAALVVAPLCVWLWLQRSLPRRARAAFVGACAAGAAIELPLFLRQYNYAPNGGLGPAASVRPISVVQVLETPFDGRFLSAVGPFRIIGALAVLSAMAILLFRGGRRRSERRLLVSLGLTAPLVMIVLGIAGKDVVITRYTAVAAPMLLTGVAAAMTSVPRAPAALLAALSLAGAIWGLDQIHQRTGFYAPAKESLSYIQDHRRADDVLIVPNNPGSAIPLGYYAPFVTHPLIPFISAPRRALILRALHQRRPVWVLREVNPLKQSVAQLRRGLAVFLRPYGYAPVLVHPVTTDTTFIVELIGPLGRG